MVDESRVKGCINDVRYLFGGYSGSPDLRAGTRMVT